MGRRRSYRRSGGGWRGWFGKRRGSPKNHSVMNWVAALVALFGIGAPVIGEAHSRWKAGQGAWGALQGAGDMLSTLFTGRLMNGSEVKSSYKYAGWYALAGALGIVIVNKVVKQFAGTIRIWKNWTVN